MAFMMKEPSRRLVKSDTVVSVNSELKAADTWFRICAADVLYLEQGLVKVVACMYTKGHTPRKRHTGFI